MIRIIIELLPGGDESRAKVFGTALIANDGTGTPTTGDYHYVVSGKRSILKGGTGTILGFRRKRDNVWELLRQVLNQMKREK